MYEGIQILNDGIDIDLNALPENSDGQFVLEGMSILKIVLKEGAKYAEQFQVLENDADAVISLIDANGEKVELVLLNISQILLQNEGETPLLELFEESESILSLSSIDELEAAASGGESSPTSSQTEDLDGSEDENTVPEVTQTDSGIVQEDIEEEESEDPTKASESETELSFSGDLSAQITEDYGLNGEGLVSGKISNSQDLSFVAQSSETQYGIFSIDEEGNWTYEFFPGKAQDLEQDENELEEFKIEVEGSDETVEVGINIVGLNDTPIIELMNKSIVEDELEDVGENENMKYEGELVASDAEGSELSFTRTGTSGLTISTEDPRLVSALNPATADLDYAKSIVSELIAIPEVQNALTNNLNAVENMDVTTLLAQFEAATSVTEALSIVLGALGVAEASLTQDENGVHLNISDTSALEAEGLLSIEVGSNGEYTVESPLFNHLSVEDSIKLVFDYIVDDGLSAGSETLTLEVGGSNDVPVLDDSNSSLSVDEDTEIGTTLATIIGLDVDVSDNVIYSLDDSSGKFAINPLTGELVLISELDFETQEEYIIDVKVTDGSGSEDVKSIEIKVNDIQEDGIPVEDGDDIPVDDGDDDTPTEPTLAVSNISEEIVEENLEDIALASGSTIDTTFKGTLVENVTSDGSSLVSTESLFALAGNINLAINTEDTQLVAALNPTTSDLDYVKSILSEVMAIPEIQIALTNNLNAVDNMDVATLIAQFQASTDVQTALGLVTNALGLANASIVPTASGMSLVIDDVTSLIEEGLLNVDVSSNGEYTVTSPLFDHLSVDDSVVVNFDYTYGNSEASTVSLEVQGTNDGIVVNPINVEVEENDLLDEALITGSSTDTTFRGQIVSSDVDINDNTSYARAGVIGLTINTVDQELLTIVSSLSEDLANAKTLISQIISVPEVNIVLSNALNAIPNMDMDTVVAQLQETTSTSEALTLFSNTLSVALNSGSIDLTSAKALLSQIVAVPEVTQLLNQTFDSIPGMDLNTLLVQFQTATTTQEALTITENALSIALNSVSEELSYVKSVITEFISIPEVTIALTNALNAVPNMDVSTLLAQFQSATDIESALELVTSALGVSGIELVPSATGLSLVIADASALEVEGLLNVEVSTSGEYEVTSPLFNHLSVDDSVSITFNYSADDGSETKTETLTLDVNGNNDLVSVEVTTSGMDQVLTITDADPDINDSGIIDMAELLANTEGLNNSELDEVNVLQGNHILSNITVDDVLSITGSDNTLEITGDTGDKLLLNLGSEISDVSEVGTGDMQWHKDTTASSDTETVYVGKTSTDETITLLINGINVEDI